MANFEITKDLLKGKNINTYMPLVEKTIHADLIAIKCVKPLRVVKESEAKEQALEQLMAFPSVVGEDTDMKEMLLLNCFLSHYLDIKVEIMDNQLYDKYMGSHIFNQFERFKQDKEVQTIAFDILTDFKTFKKMVDTEIYNLKAKQNDPIERILAGIALFGAEQITNTPEIIKKLAENIQGLAKDMTVAEKPKAESEYKDEQ